MFFLQLDWSSGCLSLLGPGLQMPYSLDSMDRKSDIDDVLYFDGALKLPAASFIQSAVGKQRTVPYLVRRHALEQLIDKLDLGVRDQEVLNIKQDLGEHAHRV